MSKVICIMGESGSGKTTSMRNLDQETTFYIDCDGKGLAWKGWRDQYKAGKNYVATDEPNTVMNLLWWLNGKTHDDRGQLVDAANKDGLNFHTVIIDTLNSIMVGEEMRKINVKGYDKWTDLATYIWGILGTSLRLRDDLTIIFTCHCETITEDDGYRFTRIKTSGRKLAKMVPESLMATVLLAEYTRDGRYVFWTRKVGTTAKTPMGAFDSETIDNDIVEVLKALDEY